MKIVDDFLKKVGTDKVLHFLVGGAITAWGALFGAIGYLVALIVVVEASVVKECLDDEFSLDDIGAALIGCGVSGALMILS